VLLLVVPPRPVQLVVEELATRLVTRFGRYVRRNNHAEPATGSPAERRNDMIVERQRRAERGGTRNPLLRRRRYNVTPTFCDFLISPRK